MPHFHNPLIETRDELVAVLEHREALLLCLLDKQVEKRERILKEQRMELAAARSRALAAKEEGELECMSFTVYVYIAAQVMYMYIHTYPCVHGVMRCTCCSICHKIKGADMIPLYLLC